VLWWLLGGANGSDQILVPRGQKVDRCFRHGCLCGSGYFEGVVVERRIATSPGADGTFDADDLDLPQPSAVEFGLECVSAARPQLAVKLMAGDVLAAITVVRSSTGMDARAARSSTLMS
jgi:hypothetical protein